MTKQKQTNKQRVVYKQRVVDGDKVELPDLISHWRWRSSRGMRSVAIIIRCRQRPLALSISCQRTISTSLVHPRADTLRTCYYTGARASGWTTRRPASRQVRWGDVAGLRTCSLYGVTLVLASQRFIMDRRRRDCVPDTHTWRDLIPDVGWPWQVTVTS